MVFFIPWRVVAEDSGAAHYGFGGAMLLDLLGPTSRRRRRFHFSDIPVRGDDRARAIGANAAFTLFSALTRAREAGAPADRAASAAAAPSRPTGSSRLCGC